MKTIILSLLFISLFTSNSFSQTVTTNPSIPTANAAVTITFDASGTGLEAYTGDVYAHTGVTIDGVGRWQHVIESWGNNSTQPKLTRISTDLYKLEITPSINEYYSVVGGEKVTEICLVFRSSDASSQSSDLFIDVFEEGLAVSITSPDVQPYFVDASSSFDIQVAASEAISVAVKSDGTTVHTETDSPNSFDYTVATAASGIHEITVEATDGSQTLIDTFVYITRSTAVVEALPANVKDGINYIDDNTVTLVLHAPYKNSVYVFGSFNDWQPVVMKKTLSDVDDINLRWWVTLTGLTAGKEYFFQYIVDEELKIAEPYSEKISDPWNDKYITDATYPDLIAYPDSKTEGIASVFQTVQTEYVWDITDFSPPATEDLIIYEALIRDFTANANYQTMIDTIGYFKNLGINAIELMPTNEFEGNDSWGYNPSFYFAVDKAYGTKNKFKEFIDTCHANGIAVIIDMVLNHSYGQSPLVQLYFDQSAGDYGQTTAQNLWYNQTSPNTSYSWGYDFNHESEYTKAFIDSVNSYWLSEYKVDGFRFDFTKGFTNTTGDGWAYDEDRITILKRMYDKIKEVNPNAYVSFEHLADNDEETVLADYGVVLWGNMNHNYNEATMGYNTNSDLSRGSYLYRGWAEPNLVSYMESHDEQRLMYKNLNNGNSHGDYNIKTLKTALERVELAACFFLTIPGPKMIWQFGELGYDISIDENGRVGKKPILWNYFDDEDRYHLFKVYRSLIALKKEHNAFRTTDYSLNVVGELKTIHLNDAEMNVTIIGNFDVMDKRIDPSFQSTGTWYEYFSGNEITVSNVNSEIILKAGEYRIYTDKKLDNPDLNTDVEVVKSGVNQAVQVNVFPNPAKNQTSISILSDELFKQVSVNVFNISGKLVRKLYSGKLQKGQNKLIWDLKSTNGQKVPSGIYFSTIEANNLAKNVMIVVD